MFANDRLKITKFLKLGPPRSNFGQTDPDQVLVG